MRKNYLKEFLYWLHISILVGSFILSWILPLGYVLIGIILHLFHIRIFNGCIITRLQKRYDRSMRNTTFYEFLIKKLFAKKLNPNQVLLVNITHLVLLLSLSLIKFVIK